MRELAAHPGLLSINTATVRKQAPLDRIIEACAARGIRYIDPWRDQVAAVGLDRITLQLKDAGIGLSGYCRGGFFTAADPAGLAAAQEDNRRAIDEAKTLGAPHVVLVVGALPGALAGRPKYTDIGLARTQVSDGIAKALEYARRVGMPLAIEPLHPMQAADRACINTLEHALDLCDALDPLPPSPSRQRRASGTTRGGAGGGGRQAHSGAGGPPPLTPPREGEGNKPMLGVALDAYHVWWDPKLAGQIARAGKERLLGYHVCDWLQPTRDLLNDRGMMGDGVIELRKLRGMVEAAGYTGPVEVEIFSDAWSGKPMDDVLDTVIARYKTVC